MAELIYQNKRQEEQTAAAAQRKGRGALADNRRGSAGARVLADKREPNVGIVQGQFGPAEVAQREALAPQPNQTGLPDGLKAGVESLSGMSLDHVRVHYNSDKPAQLQAHAYAQGADIHLGPGQAKHLPHEAWHVVQQMQGRVTPTMQMKGGVAVNDDVALEAEADLMGGRSLAAGAVQRAKTSNVAMPKNSVTQCVFILNTMAPIELSYRYTDSATNHVTEIELREDHENLENLVIPLLHEGPTFDGGANVHVDTAHFHYILSFSSEQNQFQIFHVDRRDKYKAENTKKTSMRFQKDRKDDKDPFGGEKDISHLTSDDFTRLFDL
jgi:Domain of unknown function (DUF4157)